jgi:hypothetical protein
VANEPVAVCVALRLPSSVIMQASTSRCLALPTNVQTDETPVVSGACDDGRGGSEWGAGVIVWMVQARTHPRTIRRRCPVPPLAVTLCSRNG